MVISVTYSEYENVYTVSLQFSNEFVLLFFCIVSALKFVHLLLRSFAYPPHAPISIAYIAC